MTPQELVSKKRFAAASTANLVSLVINSLLFLVITPISIKVLGKELYGIWILLLSTVQFANLANFGAGTTVTKYIAQFSVLEQDVHKVSTVILFGYVFMAVAGLAAALLLWAARPLIAGNIITEASEFVHFSGALAFTAISLPPLFLFQVSKGLLLGLVKNEIAGALEVFHNSSLWLGSVGVVSLGGTVLHLGLLILVVHISLCAISAAAAWISVRSLCTNIRCSKPIIKELFQYSILSWISSVGGLIFQSFDKIVVGFALGPALAGVYGTATSVGLRLSMAAGLFTQVLTPFASGYQAKGRKAEIYSTYQFVMLIVSFILVIAALLLVIWMDSILSLWISPDFSFQYAQVFRIVIIAYTFISLHRPAHQTLSGLGWLGVPAVVFLISGAFTLSGVFLFSKLLDLTGAALANILYSTVLVMNVYLAKKFHQKPNYLTAFVIIIEYLLLVLVSLLPLETFSPVIRSLLSIGTIVFISCFVLFAEKRRLLAFWEQKILRLI